MSKKTKRIKMTRKKTNKYSKKHKHSVHHRRSKRRYNHSHSIHHPSQVRRYRHRHRQSREISLVSVPGTKSVSLFTSTNKKNPELIRIGEKQSMGNIVPGLRTYLKNI